MAGLVVTVAQQKGGAGKSTLAANLAIAWAHAGKRVAVVDIDPQGSLDQWFGLRSADAVEIAVQAVAGWRLDATARTLARSHDVVVIDSPPHAETEARVAVRAADLVIVPMQPSPMDLWATKPTLDLAMAEGCKAIVVLNRVPPRARLTETMGAALAEAGTGVADQTIGNRVAFAAAMAAGLGVVEFEPKGRAAQEVDCLAEEIITAV